jgi:glutaredoxin 3
MNRSIHDSSITPVEIYTWKFCPFCIRAKGLLNEKGVKFTEYSIDGDNDAREKMSERAGGLRTVPQIFINGKSIGGCDELYELERNNALNKLLGISN